MGNKKELSFFQKLQRIKRAGLEDNDELKQGSVEIPCGPLPDRLNFILNLLEQSKTKPVSEMFCFIMYDIENNKIRRHLAKYLKRKGCSRVQKSIFIVQADRKKVKELIDTLAKVNQLYDNEDSIFLLPVGEDFLNRLRVIGKNVDFEMITGNLNTIFI